MQEVQRQQEALASELRALDAPDAVVDSVFLSPQPSPDLIAWLESRITEPQQGLQLATMLGFQQDSHHSAVVLARMAVLSHAEEQQENTDSCSVQDAFSAHPELFALSCGLEARDAITSHRAHNNFNKILSAKENSGRTHSKKSTRSTLDWLGVTAARPLQAAKTCIEHLQEREQKEGGGRITSAEFEALRQQYGDLHKQAHASEDEIARASEALSELNSAASAFVDIYEHELKPWCVARSIRPTTGSAGALDVNVERAVGEATAIVPDVSAFVENTAKLHVALNTARGFVDSADTDRGSREALIVNTRIHVGDSQARALSELAASFHLASS